MSDELCTPFDAADYFVDDRDGQLELIADALKTGDHAYVAHALGTVARARGGVARLATETGLERLRLRRAYGRRLKSGRLRGVSGTARPFLFCHERNGA